VTSPPPLVVAATRIAEVGLTCNQGDARSQFVELTSSADQALGPGLRLRATNAAGVVVLDVGDLFKSQPAGTPWPVGSTWLLATALFAEATGLAPDGLLPALLPADAATLALVDPGECAPRTVDEIAYGIPGAVPPPAHGRSLERTPDGLLVEALVISPIRFDGATVDANACPCPVAILTCGSAVTHHTAHAATSNCDDGGVSYDLAHGTLQSFTWGKENGGFTSVEAGDDYRIEGLPAGTMVDFAADLVLAATGCGGYDGGGFGDILVRDGANQVELVVKSPAFNQCASENRTLRLELHKPAGVPFRLTYRLRAGGDFRGSGSAQARVEFLDLPPGTRIVSCHGYVQDAPTATRITLVDHEMTSGGVRLAWHSAAGGDLEGVVERRSEVDEWTPVATLRSDAAGRFEFEDRGIEDGGRFAWRLGVLHDGVRDWSDPTWIDVPSSLRFALHGVSPNPSSSEATLTFSLARAEPVRIEIVDVQGRIVLVVDPGIAEPGRHAVRLAGSRRLGAGVYVVRLVQAGEVLTTKLARMR
jgi:hypothetical protein